MTNFSLFYDLKKDPFVFDNMLPFERQIYLDLLYERLKENDNTPNIPTEADFLGQG